MKIDNIILNNFGSYEGETIFDLQCSGQKNIVLIGGKNGAGKTTLFTAMRLCLYGHLSMGYKNLNAFYVRAITKLINNTAKLNKPAKAYVKMQIKISNGQELDTYILKRFWQLNDNLSETFEVSKNGCNLDSSTIADFEKYILSLIPPELFNLYFFDGEKIADFFLTDGSSTRVKDAFLTLCGYDIFDIMRRNFKRIGTGNDEHARHLEEYMQAKKSVADLKDEIEQINIRLNESIVNLSNCDADITSLDKEYSQKGGLTQQEWEERVQIIKEEEKKREIWSLQLKKWANEIIPFLILQDQLNKIKEQINREKNSLKYQSLCEILTTDKIRHLLGDKIDEIKRVAFDEFGNDSERILDLSLEQSAIVNNQIDKIFTIKKEDIFNYKELIQQSREISIRIRNELDNSSVGNAQEYIANRTRLVETKHNLQNEIGLLQNQLDGKIEALQNVELLFSRSKKVLEESIKKESIIDISAKSILMLDKLQNVLYQKQINKVEDFFRNEISVLMRKENFIDDIVIDNNFNVHLYKNTSIDKDSLIKAIKTRTMNQLKEYFGEKAVSSIIETTGAANIPGMINYYQHGANDEVVLPVEIDKDSFSNGEKQIFIMALYKSLINLCISEVPFVIDTPFARIDTEHRENITKYFFSRLNGQVFILSTNEEIEASHLDILKDKIAATFMLENNDNKRTLVTKGTYFEV